jgi:bifunctional non-homologous end joining protein LigD
LKFIEVLVASLRRRVHALGYGSFQGIIPAGHYGAGEVLIWDEGSYEPLLDFEEGLAAGAIRFRLHGNKLTGTVK